MATIATASISGPGVFTTPVQLAGHYNVSVNGVFSANVTVQRSVDSVTWHDVVSFVGPAEHAGFEPEIMWYRVGVKTGQYVSGTSLIRLGREDKVH